MRLSNDDFAHLLTQSIDKEALSLDTFIKLFNVNYFAHKFYCLYLSFILSLFLFLPALADI